MNDVAKTAGGPDRLARLGIQRGERASVALSFVTFFCVLASYFTVRPLREAMGASLPKGELAQLFTVVFFVMVALVPLFGVIATRLPRRLVLPTVYGFFIVNLLGFWWALQVSAPGVAMAPAVARAFFVWVSVYNLFVVSLFWSVMADRWSSEEGKRLFGIISAGGTLGALTGPLLAGQLVGIIGTANLTLVSASFLGAALAASLLIGRAATPDRTDAPPPATLALVLAGARDVARDPYLRAIALVILLANLVSTFFYLEQSRLVKETIAGSVAQVEFFASRDLIVSVVTTAIQLLGTAAILARLGLTVALAALPAVCIAGLVTIGFVPTLAVVSGVMSFERVTAFAVAGPAMRVLFTVVDPDAKYKAQNFIDTVVYRGGDALSGWMFGAFAALSLSAGATIACTLPLAGVWLWSCLGLGRMQAERAANRPPDVSHVASPVCTQPHKA